MSTERSNDRIEHTLSRAEQVQELTWLGNELRAALDQYEDPVQRERLANLIAEVDAAIERLRGPRAGE